jgi:hypothetical protein
LGENLTDFGYVRGISSGAPLEGRFDQHLLKPVTVASVVAVLNAAAAGTDAKS